ncbi:MAG: MerR family transcriptional regulator [Armatimonadota bacterium]|nr:MerR family transcriptional regulator [Armatimonadota bacterium]
MAQKRDEDEPVYMIGVAAKLCEMHPQTLRMYERIGLIKPKRVGRKNRMYSDRDIERLRQIQRLTHDLGVNLAGVEVIFRLLEQMENMRKTMEEEVNRIREEMERRIMELEQQHQ